MTNFFIDANGKQIVQNDHVHHSSRTDLTKYENRRGIILQIHPLDKEALVWFYDTRASEYAKWSDLTKPAY